MKEIVLTQGKIALVDDEDFEYLNQFNWHYNNAGYAVRHIPLSKKVIMMHRELLQTSIEFQVDHINGDGLDNRKENLRNCTCAENQHNSKLRKDNPSGYKGVSKCRNKWQVTIVINGKNKYLGLFDNPEEAGYIYDNAAIKYFGKFAKLNKDINIDMVSTDDETSPVEEEE